MDYHASDASAGRIYFYNGSSVTGSFTMQANKSVSYANMKNFSLSGTTLTITDI